MKQRIPIGTLILIILVALAYAMQVLRLPIAVAAPSSVKTIRSVVDDVIPPGATVNVTLKILVSADVTAIIANERLPLNFKLNTSNPDYTKYDPATNTWTWLIYNRNGVGNTTINYTIKISFKTTEGVYSIKGNWSALGSEKIPFSGESAPTEINVKRFESALMLSASTLNIKVGETLTIYGSISPPLSNVNITLKYVKPDNSSFETIVQTSTDGKFVDVRKLDMIGLWNLTASWNGDQQYKGAKSSTLSIAVEPITEESIAEKPGMEKTNVEQGSMQTMILILTMVSVCLILVSSLVLLMRRRSG
ncbi:MAG: hypothetical protein QW222_02885 [Candidatus Bathyarchaeia archaeon]